MDPGKSTLLRSVALAASFTVRGGPCHVYAVDFGARGLAMLEGLPHVGSVIAGSDAERIGRLITWLRGLVDDRATRYAAAKSGSITDYRRLAKSPQEPRIILLVDGAPAFRQAYELGDRARLFDAFVSIATDGRPVGVHVVLSADRPGAIPSALASALQRRVILRLADEGDYGLLGVPNDILTPTSPPGRGLLDDVEIQVAILGPSSDLHDQVVAAAGLGASMERAGVTAAPQVRRLTERVLLSDLAPAIAGKPVIGVSSTTLAPCGFSPDGPFVLTGPPGSGRSSALATILASFERNSQEAARYYIGSYASSLPARGGWSDVACTPEDAARLAAEIGSAISADPSVPIAVVIEGLPDFLNGPADAPLQELIKCAARTGKFIICEGEVSAFMSSYPLLLAARSGRAGFCLQPDQLDGTVFKTDFPRLRRGEFPVGRGVLVAKGKVETVQLGLTDMTSD